MNPALIAIPAVLAIRIFADRLDRDRIREHIEKSAGKVLDITWNPFGKGWFGTRNERIYEVRYRTRRGKEVEATCKTSMLSGVYWTGTSVPGDIDEPADEQEPTQCMGCGSTIPANKSRCPKCGWSYKDR